MINIKVVRRSDARDKTLPGLYYGCVKSFDKVTIEQLAERIAANCTVTRTDCLAVLAALQEQAVFSLQQGARVSLGDLGSLRLTCQSSGSATPEEFECNDVKKLRIIFTPSSKLRKAVQLDNGNIQLNNLFKEGIPTTPEKTDAPNE